MREGVERSLDREEKPVDLPEVREFERVPCGGTDIFGRVVVVAVDEVDGSACARCHAIGTEASTFTR